MARSAFDRLAPLASRGMVLDLASMTAALAAFGDPQRRLRTVHIAGTNGKGSVTAMVSSVLRTAGMRVGTYTSPHLHRFVERVAIDGEPVAEDIAARHADTILAAIASGTIPSLTFFEAATLLAWLVFAEAKVDVVVLEVGLGGRLDATNVCVPTVCAITRIARDHEAILGEGLSAIATEKAGILKEGVPCVLGPSWEEESYFAIVKVARAVGAPLVEAKPIVDDDGRWRVSLGGSRVEVKPVLGGGYQSANVAVAVQVLHELTMRGFFITPEEVLDGLAATRWPARMERIGNVLFDAAHNPDGVEALLAHVGRVIAPATVGALVFGASRDKNHAAMVARLATLVGPSRRFFAAAAMPRAEAPETLAGYEGGEVCASPEEALARAQAVVDADEIVLVCGSIFLVAAVRASLLGIEQEPFIGL